MAAKKKIPTSRHKHPMVPFRADDDTRAALDDLTTHYSQQIGVPLTRSDTLRKLIKEAREKIRK